MSATRRHRRWPIESLHGCSTFDGRLLNFLVLESISLIVTGPDPASMYAEAKFSSASASLKALAPYLEAGLTPEPTSAELSDPAGKHLPLVLQKAGRTAVVEQPVDLTTVGAKYAAFSEVRHMTLAKVVARVVH